MSATKEHLLFNRATEDCQEPGYDAIDADYFAERYASEFLQVGDRVVLITVPTNKKICGGFQEGLQGEVHKVKFTS